MCTSHFGSLCLPYGIKSSHNGLSYQRNSYIEYLNYVAMYVQ